MRTVDDWIPAYFAEAARQAREMPIERPGRQACCGATNRCCTTKPRVVFMLNTGCDQCGHSLGCHVWQEAYA